MECELTEMNMGLNSVRHVREEKKGGGGDTKRERGGVDGRGREGVGGSRRERKCEGRGCISNYGWSG